jgi:ABC-2 type transport system permease protein
MNDLRLILGVSLKNNFRSTVLNLVVLCVVILIAVGLAVTFCLVLIKPALQVPSPDRSALLSYLALIMYVTCLLGLGVNMNASAFSTLTREKSRGVIQSLLAAPLRLSDIWIAKSLAVFLPGYILGAIFTLIVLFALNFIYFIPQIGFLINPWIIISNFVALPLVYLGLSMIVHLVGLTGKPVNGNVIVQIVLPALMGLMINLVVRSVLDAGSWVFMLVNFGLAAVCGLIILIVKNRLDIERIILSI